MKRNLALFCLGVALSWSNPNAGGAESVPRETSGSANATDTGLVGLLGRKEALVFEGNTTFTTDQINDALRQEIGFHLAAHPAALLVEYVAKLQEMVHAGYEREGFPAATVMVDPEPEAKRILVRITEGPRYKTGAVRFKGVKAIDDPALQRALAAAISGWKDSGGQNTSTNALKALWPDGGYVPFDEASVADLKDRLTEELAGHNFYRPSLKLTIEPNAQEKKASLLIEMLDEGLKGSIDEVNVIYPIKEKKNTDQEVLDYLALKAGMPFRADLLSDVTNRLWRSGRFFQQQVELRPLPEVGRFKLDLHLEETEDSPPLRQLLATNELAFLKLADWLNEFEKHPEDLAFSGRGFLTNYGPVELEAALSKSGLALMVRAGPSNAAPQLTYALVVSEKVAGLYSGWRQRKYVTRGNQDIGVFVSVMPRANATKPDEYGLMIGAGFGSKQGERPTALSIKVAPSKFLSLAHEPEFKYNVNGGVLSASFREHSEGDVMVLKIDVQSGRLLESSTRTRTNKLEIASRVYSEEGAYAKLITRIASLTADWKNDYRPSQPISSWLGFALTDLFDSGILESAFYTNYMASSSDEATKIPQIARQIRQGLERLKAARGKQELAECFMPLEEKLQKAFPFGTDADEEKDVFSIPQPPGPMKSQMAMVFDWVGGYLVNKSDLVWPRDTWAWVLTREAGFSLGGHNKYTSAELEKLPRSQQTGPLGCWAASALLAKFNAPLAEKFARRGLEQLSAKGVQGDLDVLLAPETAAGQLLGDLLSSIGELKPGDLDALAALVGDGSTNLLREVAGLLRAGTNRPPAEVLSPALVDAWDPVVKPWLESQLRTWLTRVGTPGTPHEAFHRGEFIEQSATKPEDFREAFKMYQLAADQGFAKAQMRLGMFYEAGKGVDQDYGEARNYYVKAADQNERHASCRVADMYFQGLGVEQDKAVAMKWYERDATNQCARSQFLLAKCAEDQSKPAEALAWHRQAGTNGTIGAAMALGDRLSDDLTGTPDFAEAYLWYHFAEEKGVRLAAGPAKRMRIKLTNTQVEQADNEVARLLKKSDEAAASSPP